MKFNYISFCKVYFVSLILTFISCKNNDRIKEQLINVEQKVKQGEFSAKDESFLLELINRDFKEDSLRNKVFFNLGDGYRLKKDYKKSLAFFFKSFETGIDSHHSANAIGYVNAGQNKFVESDKWYNESLRIKPDYVLALGNLSFNQIFNKDYKAAKLTLDKAVDISPYNFAIVNNLGYCYLMLDEYELSTYFIERALDIQPENDLVILNKAHLLLKTNGVNYAEKYLNLHSDLIFNDIYSNYIKFLIVKESGNLNELCDVFLKLDTEQLKELYNVEVSLIDCK